MLNSRLTLFAAAPLSSRSKSDHQKEHPLFRSYGAILPSSLTRVISSALGFSPHLPVSDCGTDTNETHGTKIFSAVWGYEVGLSKLALPDSPQRNIGPDLPKPIAYRFRMPNPSGIITTLLRLSTVSLSPHSRCRNFHLLTISYASRPRLRTRLTLG